jgi:hypothetical protein
LFKKSKPRPSECGGPDDDSQWRSLVWADELPYRQWVKFLQALLRSGYKDELLNDGLLSGTLNSNFMGRVDDVCSAFDDFVSFLRHLPVHILKCPMGDLLKLCLIMDLRFIR